MFLLSLGLGVALAGGADPLVRPSVPDPVERECPRSFALRVGERPPPGLVDETTGLVACQAVAEPVSRLLYLLQVERHRNAIEELHAVDVRVLKAERDWYAVRYKEAAGPGVWYERPAVQRWTGRLETLLAVAVVGGVLAVTYDQGGE